MNLPNAILEMFMLLRGADDRLQTAFRSLLQRYFQFLHSPSNRSFRSTGWLRMRTELDRQKRIRRLAWTIRIKATRIEEGRVKRLTRRLRGRFHPDWVYKIAKDWARLKDYKAFERERRTLNGLRSNLVNCQMRLRLSFENAWAHQALPEHRREVDRLAATLPFLTARDVRPLAGVLAYQRAFLSLEHDLGCLVDRYRTLFARSITVRFEPGLRPTEGGALRLYWGFPQRVATAQGPRTFTDYLPGRPTDALMRRLCIATRTRRQVGAFLKRILPVERRYRKLVGFLGNHRRRVRELMARIALLEIPRAPLGGRVPARGAIPQGSGTMRGTRREVR